jgi:hypothetical protein
MLGFKTVLSSARNVVAEKGNLFPPTKQFYNVSIGNKFQTLLRDLETIFSLASQIFVLVVPAFQ